jgi:hypothetical protein
VTCVPGTLGRSTPRTPDGFETREGLELTSDSDKPEVGGISVDLAIRRNRTRSMRRRRQSTMILAIVSSGFLGLGTFALAESLRPSSPGAAVNYLLTGCFGVAIGLFIAVFTVATFYRKGWFGSWPGTYGDGPGGRWAVSASAGDQEPFPCPKCGATNLRVSPSCWRCGVALNP